MSPLVPTFLGLAAATLLFLYSGAEIALLSASRVRILHHAGGNSRRARALAGLYLRGRDPLFGGTLILTGALTIFLFAVLTRETVATFGNTGYPVAFALAAPLYLFFGQLLPKAIARRFPYRYLLAVLPFLQIVGVTTAPLVRWITRLVADPAPFAPGASISEDEGDPEIGRREFRQLTDRIEQEGTISPEEHHLIDAIIDFQEVRARDIMVRIASVTSFPRDMPVAAALKIARQTGYEDFPVFGADGHPEGAVHTGTLLRIPGHLGSIAPHITRIHQVRPGDSALGIILDLRTIGCRLAIVQAPGGSPLGVITVEDLEARILARA